MFFKFKSFKTSRKNPEKVLKKLNELEEKVKESPKDLIGINDPDARLIKKKSTIYGINHFKKTISLTMQKLKHVSTL